VQTPQREWLKGPLKSWANECIEDCLAVYGGTWLDAGAVRREWKDYCSGDADNSFYIWQWISIGLCEQAAVAA
jgi:asparagine synthase (glutamine-hydrolysing)